MKKKSAIVFLLLACVAVGLFSLTACDNTQSKPSYCGTYYSGYPNDSDTSKLIVTENYVSSGKSKYKYTYSGGTITLSSGVELIIAQNYQVAYFPSTRMASSYGNITVRNGYFSARFTASFGLSETAFTFNSDGTFEFVNTISPASTSGTYCLKNGVLSMVNKNASASLGYLDKLHFWYIDENLNIYSGVSVKDYTLFQAVSPSAPDDPGGNESDEQTYTVTWKNHDGTVLEVDKNVKLYTIPSYDGETPTKEQPSEDFKFVFNGWSPEVSPVTDDVTYMADFVLKQLYTVTWENYDYSVLKVDKGIEYGAMPSYNGATPTRPTAYGVKYTFKGWTPTIVSVTSNVTYIAEYDEEEEDKFYTVTWKNYNGTILEIDENVREGTAPSYDGETPTRATDDEYEYTFSGWSPSVSAVRDDVTYIAQYEKKYYIPNLPQNTTPKLETPDHSFEGDGTKENPYLIKTSAQLLGMETLPDKYFALANDIVLPLNDENRPNFKPLFSDEKPFIGTLDGKGFAIDNLFLYNTETYYTGLFACIGNSGRVENLNLKNVTIFGANYIGGIAGLSYGTITNCSVSGKITYITANSYSVVIGGIAGRMENVFLNCNADVTITVLDFGSTCYVGGIVGYFDYNNRNNPVTDCVSRGTILLKPAKTGSDPSTYVGGLVGYSSSSSTITSSYNTGKITVSDISYHVYVGGLVGYSYSSSTITSNYNTGDITVSNSDYAYVGGLVGESGSSSTITSSYNTGKITVSDISYHVYVGGLVGESSSITITSSYNTGDITVSDISYHVYVGGLVGYSYSSSTITSSYNTGEITVSDISRDARVGGLVGESSSITITSSYNTGKITVSNISRNAYVGGLVGYGSVTLTNCHWLYDESNLPVNAVGYNSSMGVPTNIGSTKHTDIADFYTLAETLNEGLDSPIWENKTATSLPTLITPGGDK